MKTVRNFVKQCDSVWLAVLKNFWEFVDFYVDSHTRVALSMAPQVTNIEDLPVFIELQQEMMTLYAEILNLKVERYKKQVAGLEKNLNKEI